MGKIGDFRKTAEFREQFRKDSSPSESGCGSWFACNRKRLQKCLTRTVPSYRIMKKYNWKTDTLSDLICGLTVGIMQLPQGMAYAMLAEMPPVVGLYMSFFPVLIYFIFGSSRHNSMGTVAVVSLLTGSVISRFYDDVTNGDTITSYNQTDIANQSVETITITDSEPSLPLEVKIGIAMTICILVGFTQIILGILRLGFVTTYMSDPLVSGFTTATAIHVGTSQIKYVLGLKIPRTDGLFQVIKTYQFLIERIHNVNVATLVTSAVCITVLYLVKAQINARFKEKLKVPIPIELLVVIAGTLASYFGYFRDTYGMKTVGEVPAGLPTPTLPSFYGVDKYIADIPIIAIISFAQSVSLAALMAKKHKYAIDSNQELIAYGAGNVFGSFFSCYPFAASVSRTSVCDSAGGKSQMASVFSALMVLVVILWLGPLFEPLPNCVLSSIIIVALRGLLLQIMELPALWRASHFDFFIWLVTFLAATLLHVDYGLVIGLVFSFFTVVVRTQRAKPTRLAKLSEYNVYKDPNKYIKTQSHKTIKVIGFASPLYFANGDLFVKHVYRLSAVKPERLRKEIRRASQFSESSRRSSMISTASSPSVNQLGLTHSVSMTSMTSMVSMTGLDGAFPFYFELPITHIILDFSAISFVDTVGCKVIKQIIQDYATVKVSIYLANVSDDNWRVLEETGIVPKYKDVIFVSVDDAIMAANDDIKDVGVKNGSRSQISLLEISDNASS